MTSRRPLIGLALAALAVLALFVLHRLRTEPASAGMHERVAPDAVQAIERTSLPAEPAAGPAAMRPGEPVRDPRDTPLTAVPATNPNPPHRVWVRAEYGEGPGSLGIQHPGEGYDGDSRPPQGFVPTRDGKLLVLDSAKLRLVWFGQDGRMERTLPLSRLVMPADVAEARDGTIVVVDHEGAHTAGTVLIDSSGKIKGKFPQFAGGLMTEMYTVGNDVFFGVAGGSSVKAGETNGAPSDETPGLYDRDGKVPGTVATDGRTVLTTGIHDAQKGQFFVSAIEGEPPKHLFTRLYAVEPRLSTIPHLQADGRGRIYVVLDHDEMLTLVCIDGKTGDATGRVELPIHEGTYFGTPFRTFNVVESGGIVQQQLSEQGSTYHWFDCG